jgi:Phage integrase family
MIQRPGSVAPYLQIGGLIVLLVAAAMLLAASYGEDQIAGDATVSRRAEAVLGTTAIVELTAREAVANARSWDNGVASSQELDRAHATMADMVSRLRAQLTQLEERLRAGTAWEAGEWCFTDEIEAPWRPDGLTLKFVRSVKALGLPGTDIKSLRHAHATALLRAGVHPKVVQERLGHSSISVTMDIYSSVLPGMQREAVEKLAAMMGRG